MLWRHQGRRQKRQKKIAEKKKDRKRGGRGKLATFFFFLFFLSHLSLLKNKSKKRAKSLQGKGENSLASMGGKKGDIMKGVWAIGEKDMGRERRGGKRQTRRGSRNGKGRKERRKREEAKRRRSAWSESLHEGCLLEVHLHQPPHGVLGAVPGTRGRGEGLGEARSLL